METNPPSPEGETWERESAHAKATRGLEVEAEIRGLTPAQEIRRRAEAAGNRVVSDGTRPLSLGRRILKFLVKV